MFDISEYYTKELAEKEEKAWLECELYKRNAKQVNDYIIKYDLSTVLEVGCGSGLIPTLIPNKIYYSGIDNNSYFLEMARKNNKSRIFVKADIRSYHIIFRYDLVISFAFLKHFAISEWVDIASKVLQLGRFGIIEVQIAEKAFDNGIDFHHTFVTEKMLSEALETAGRKEESRISTFKDKQFEVFSVMTCLE